MQLPIDKKILILRYGTNIISDCMKLHLLIINMNVKDRNFVLDRNYRRNARWQILNF